MSSAAGVAFVHRLTIATFVQHYLSAHSMAYCDLGTGRQENRLRDYELTDDLHVRQESVKTA